MTREEAIAVLESDAEYMYSQDSPYNREAYQMAVEALEAEPIKHGRWEMYGVITQGTLAIPTYRCSECKEDTNNWFWHYCPNCGADMRGGENG